ncbi:gliding motility-associated C-terminal domain-containing protein [Bacteroidales bacterium OttesenSCG-928-B11]|nr:gliding motility-associated C-terminal domain-containing protein [Bacteroidales bacterium OttesenSCG-928-C03]MDL2312275.1 gliding motility-associated C-terminal domain-containing protein [Bacteroidales bacterium OttesenSCG-928-B11]
MKSLRILFIVALCLFVLQPLFPQIDAGKDMTVCPGDIVRFSSWADTSQYLYYRWEPQGYVSDPEAVSPYATGHPGKTTTYYFYAYKPDTVNAVVNGDFQQGNMGFSSSYSFRNAPVTLNWAQYTIATSGTDGNSVFYNLYDHTYGNAQGKFMCIDAASTAGVMVWEQQINNIVPNSKYVFHAWVATMYADNINQAPVLQFSINGVLLDQPFTGPYPRTTGWVRFYTLWDSGNNTSATIRIVNQNTTQTGNDFGLDDIFFSQVIYDLDSVTIWQGPADSTRTIVEMCANSSYVFGDRIIVGSGEYSDTLVNSMGCDSISWLEIRFYPELTVELIEDQIICREDTASITLSPQADYYAYRWNTGDTVQQIVVTESGTYTLTVTNEIGCEAVASVDILFVDSPETAITSNTDNFCDEYKMRLSVETEAPDIIWSTGDITAEIEVSDFGTYYVTVSEYHCFSMDTFEVAFCCPPESYLPNVITPSKQDGINDFFEFSKILPFESIKLYIYDRWGKKIFYTTNPEFQWDGTVGGKLLQGLYYYVLEFEDGCSFHGSVTVL